MWKRLYIYMNIVNSDTRTKLLVFHVFSLMFIKLITLQIGFLLLLLLPSSSEIREFNHAWSREHRSATDRQTCALWSKDKIKQHPLWQFLANVNSSSGSLYVIVRPSVVCLSSVVCNVRAPYSGDWHFRQYFNAIWYIGHLWPLYKNFTEIVPGEPLRRGS